MKKKGHVVVTPKKKVKSSSAPSTPAKETPEELQKRIQEAEVAATEAAKRVRLHAAEMRKKKKNNSSTDMSPAMKNKMNEKIQAAHKRLLHRAKIYAMNCLMKSFRQVQIQNFHQNQKTNSVGGGGDSGKEAVEEMATEMATEMEGKVQGTETGRGEEMKKETAHVNLVSV